MTVSQSLSCLAGALVLCTAVQAADPAPEFKPTMTQPGKLLFSDDLSQSPDSEWKTGKGKWEAADGALKGTEVEADNHAATTRHKIAFQNGVIQYAFKLDGAKSTSFSINTDKGHLCRVTITPTGFTVRKDQPTKDSTEKAETLDKQKAEIKAGEWHTMQIELLGKEMLASLDGKAVAFGANDALDVEKANFGLTVSGDSASFKNLRVWEAQANPDWDAAKAKLTEAKSKKAGEAK
jgi:hypothetical protein